MKIFGMFVLIAIMGMTPIITENSELIVAPEISLETPSGETLKLSSLRGNIVLIDFWASWCGPCKKSRPGLKAVYNQFEKESFKNASKFEIYSVSLDNKKENWTNAIDSYGLDWTNHVSELKGWNSDVVKTYEIKGIPQNILLNEKGEIIARNIYKEDLVLALEKLQ